MSHLNRRDHRTRLSRPIVRAAGAAVLIAVLIAVLTFGVAGCGAGGGTGGTSPAATPLAPSLSPAIAETRREISTALAKDQFQLQDAQQPYRPPESASLATAPRGVFQVVMPADPTHGYMVVYEFRDDAAAAAAGHELAAYVSSGPGRIQFPGDAQHVIRQLGTTLIVYSWSPSNASDPRAASIVTDLSAIGTPIDIPR